MERELKKKKRDNAVLLLNVYKKYKKNVPRVAELGTVVIIYRQQTPFVLSKF